MDTNYSIDYSYDKYISDRLILVQNNKIKLLWE